MTTSQPTGSVNLNLGALGVKAQTDLVVSAGRQNERSFVASSLQSSSILPGVQTNASRSGFSTDRYTTTSSLSRASEEILNVSPGSFARTEYKSPELDEEGRTEVAGGYWDSKLGAFFRDQPNRLITPTSTQGTVWAILWEYVSDFPFIPDNNIVLKRTYNTPMGFYGGFDLTDAIVNSPSKYSSVVVFGESYTSLLWSTSFGETQQPKRVTGPFSTYSLEIPIWLDNENPNRDTESSGIFEVFYDLDISPEISATDTGAPVLNGTLQADIWNTSDTDDDPLQQVYVVLAEPNDNGWTRTIIGSITLSVYLPEDEVRVLRVQFECLKPLGSTDFEKYRVTQILPSGNPGWDRVSLTLDNTVAYAHYNGEYIGSCSINTLENVPGRRLVLSGAARTYTALRPGKNAKLGSVTFTDEILYGPTNYTVTSLLD